MKFKKGDKVRVKSSDEIRKNPKSLNKSYRVGKTYFTNEMFQFCDKEFVVCEVFLHWYRLSGAYSLLFSEEMLEEVNESQEVHFRRDGNKVYCVYKNAGKVERTLARCSPDDDFDFYTGCQVAFARLSINKKIDENEPMVFSKLKYVETIGYERYIFLRFNGLCEWIEKLDGKIAKDVFGIPKYCLVKKSEWELSNKQC